MYVALDYINCSLDYINNMENNLHYEVDGVGLRLCLQPFTITMKSIDYIINYLCPVFIHAQWP